MANHSLLSFFTLMAALLLSACGEPEKTPETTMDILAGTYTQGQSEGIYRLKFNPGTGALSNEGLVAKTEQPSFLLVSKEQNTVYAVHETATFNGQPGGGVSAFKWDESREKLSVINSRNTGGAHPCYLSANGRFLSVANYSGGNVAIFKLGENGGLEDGPQMRQHEGSGPNAARQEGPHAHCSAWRPDNRYLYVADLGIDEVVAYPFDSSNGTLGERATALKATPGSGPRLLAFHPTEPLAFLVNELANTVASVSYRPDSPEFTPIQEESTLPAGYQGENTCAHIQLSPDGRFLYVSNRGHDSIAAFSVSKAGKLELAGIEPTRGQTPRFFTITPDGQYLLAANQNSNSVVVFRRDQETGKLEARGVQAEVYSPVGLQFVN